MQTDSEYPTPAEEALERLHKDLAAHRAALKVATDYLTAIAKPALGGKLQQYAAQEALKKLKALLP